MPSEKRAGLTAAILVVQLLWVNCPARAYDPACHEQKLLAPDGYEQQAFGSTVSLDEGLLICGALSDDQVTFPDGYYMVAGVLKDSNSINSPDLDVSLTNWIRVRSMP